MTTEHLDVASVTQELGVQLYCTLSNINSNLSSFMWQVAGRWTVQNFVLNLTSAT